MHVVSQDVLIDELGIFRGAFRKEQSNERIRVQVR
jgi:hypothetical protein